MKTTHLGPLIWHLGHVTFKFSLDQANIEGCSVLKQIVQPIVGAPVKGRLGLNCNRRKNMSADENLGIMRKNI